MPRMDSLGSPQRILLSTSADNLAKVLSLLIQNGCFNITISQTPPSLKGSCDVFLTFLQFESSLLWVAARLREENNRQSWNILHSKLEGVATVLEAPSLQNLIH